MSYHQSWELQLASSKATSKCPVGQEGKIQTDEAVLGLVPETFLKGWPDTLQARQPEAGEIVKSLGIESEKFQTNEKMV